jgi:hypothetical protein
MWITPPLTVVALEEDNPLRDEGLDVHDVHRYFKMRRYTGCDRWLSAVENENIKLT